MNIHDLQRNWDKFGEEDPLWAILTDAGKKHGAWDVSAFFQTGRQEIDHLFRQLAGMKIALPPGRALDFGCGTGRLTQALARHFQEVTGVDIAPSMIAKAREFNTFGDQVTYHLNAKNDLSQFESESFSFVYTNITLQHMRPRYARVYLQEFVRLLKPEGVLVFQLPAVNRNKSLGGWFYRLASYLDHDLGAALAQRIMRRTITLGHEPIMEMYGTTPKQIRNWFRGQPVSFLQVRENKDAGDQWQSFRYVLQRVR